MAQSRVTEVDLAMRFQSTVEASGIIDAWDYFLDWAERGHGWRSEISGVTAVQACDAWLNDYSKSDATIAREYRNETARNRKPKANKYQTHSYTKWNKGQGPNGGAVMRWRTISDGKERQVQDHDVVEYLGAC